MALDLEAIELIKQLKGRYFRAIDTANMDLLRTCFTDTSTVAFKGSNYTIELTGPDEIVDFMETAFNSNVAASHFGHHPEITVTGDTATGIWYLFDIFHDLDIGIRRTGSALYEDAYIKSGDKWFISHTGYDRVWERLEKLEDADNFTYRLLAETGLKTNKRALKDRKYD